MNPYRKTTKSTFEPGFTKLPGQSNPAVNRQGEINASSNQDLLGQIGAILDQNNAAVQSGDRITTNRDRSEALVEAMADKQGNSMQVLGEALAAEIQETTDREGFARRLLQYNEVGQGEVNEVVVKKKNVVGFTATSPSAVNAVEIRQRRILPPEFHLSGYILIDTLELGRSSQDLLEEKYEEGLEAIMVQEDRLWKTIADEASTVRNTFQTFSTFTPAVFARLLNQVSQWGIPPTSCLFSSSLWQDIIANNDFSGVLDPVTKWELLQEGYLGAMYGVSMLTDNFRQENLKVLDTGEIYIAGAPINHGVLTVRGNIEATPIDKYADGEPKRGWFMDQITSLTMANALSVAKGKKI